MTAKVLTAHDQMHIVGLIDLLSDRGMHHVPIVNAENRLCGMVTQSDLIAALFHSGN
jgi:CBS domain-containing membrane protein